MLLRFALFLNELRNAMLLQESEKVNISRDVEQKWMFCMVGGRGRAGRMRRRICSRAALPQTPNQRKTWKPEALIADT